MHFVVGNSRTRQHLEWLGSFQVRWERCVLLSVGHDDANRPRESASPKEIYAARNGDHDAFQRLIERYQETIATQMRRFSRDRDVLEELVHDVFVEAFVSLSSFRGSSPFEHWLRKIAVRVGYRHWKAKARDQRRVRLIRENAPATPALVEPPTDAFEANDQLHSVFSKLSPRDRLVLTLLYWEGHSVAEAAKLAGWTQSMVKVQSHRARKRLRKLLERVDEG